MFPGPGGNFFRYYEAILNETITYPDTYYRGVDPEELPRHFIDLEIWNESRPETGTLPYAVDAYAKHMSDTIRAGDWNQVLLDAGRVAHYISDICQPYHSTASYDPLTRSGMGLHTLLDAAITDHLSEIMFVKSFGSPQMVDFKEYAILLAKQSFHFLA